MFLRARMVLVVLVVLVVLPSVLVVFVLVVRVVALVVLVVRVLVWGLLLVGLGPRWGLWPRPRPSICVCITCCHFLPLATVIVCCRVPSLTIVRYSPPSIPITWYRLVSPAIMCCRLVSLAIAFYCSPPLGAA